jgi:hypothetical protein
MNQYPLNDTDFEEYKITKVVDEDTHWGIHTTESSLLSFPKVEGATPKEGSVLRTYPGGFGRQVRGVFVDGQKVYYRTEEEEKERHKQWVAEEDRKKREEAEKNAPEVDARVAKLPGPFQDRIKGFRERNPNFRWEFEPYELFCCEQAVVFALALKTPEAIEKFAKADYDEQMRMLPNLDQNHSGNTMGTSLRLAHMFASDQQEFIRKSHGAMCPLAGCEDYGCYAASLEATATRVPF